MTSEIAVFCGAPTDSGLLVEIDKRLQEIRQEHKVEVISISHSTTTTGTGSIFWNALITCRIIPGLTRGEILERLPIIETDNN